MIDQGPPDDVMIAYSNGHESLPNVPLTGMLNKVGHKVFTNIPFVKYLMLKWRQWLVYFQVN